MNIPEEALKCYKIISHLKERIDGLSKLAEGLLEDTQDPHSIFVNLSIKQKEYEQSDLLSLLFFGMNVQEKHNVEVDTKTAIRVLNAIIEDAKEELRAHVAKAQSLTKDIQPETGH